MKDYDVIVLGGGGAGMAAAYRATERGLSVLLIEAADRLGGATALSTGVVYAAGTATQRAAGITDSADAMYEYMMALNNWSIKPALARRLCEDGAGVIDWLIELGNKFPPDWLMISGVESVPRGHQSAGAGIGIAASLINAVGSKSVEVALGSRAEKLLVENDRVVGVRAAGADVRADAVIVTTGGFANNPALVERLYPTAAFHGDRTFSVYQDAPFNLGDGILMSEAIGARVAGIDNGLLSPTPNFSKAIEAFVPDWSIVVNRDGRRFMPETASYTISGYLINDQPEKRCFAVFDDATLRACAEDEGSDKRYNSSAAKYQNGPGSESWRASEIRKHLAKGRVKSADTLEELARRADISVPGLVETVRRYNADCARREDRDFHKKLETFHPIESGPFYAVEVRASMIVSTQSGLEIDIQGRVLDRHGAIIEGLYSGGEVAGCTLGRRYIGGGIGIANALVFGSLAGRNAALD